MSETEDRRDQTHPGTAPPRGGVDLELVRAARRGDSRAIEALSDRFRCVPRFVASRNKRLRSPLADDELRDLVQDILVTVWHKLDTFSGLSTFESWVYPFCVHKLQNALSRRGRRAEIVAFHPPEDLEVHPDVAAPPSVDAERLASGLERLGPPKADVIRMRHFDGLGFETIALRLDVPVETAKTWYYRGIKSLRDALGAKLRETEQD